MLIILSVTVGLSLSANLALFLWARKLKKTPQETYDVARLLHDLTAGSGLVKVERVDPASVFLRSPRGSA